MGAYSDVYQLIITSIFHQLFLNCKTHVCTQYLLLCKLKKTSPWLVISYRRCWSWISIIDGFIHNNLSSAIFFLANINQYYVLLWGVRIFRGRWKNDRNSGIWQSGISKSLASMYSRIFCLCAYGHCIAVHLSCGFPFPV